MKVKKVIKVRRYKCGYEVREELMDGSDLGIADYFAKNAYTPNGDWIGSPEDAHRLVAVRGIQPMIAKICHCVCSIGYSVKDGKWYGWSHRAIYGFKVGSTCKKGDCGCRGVEWTAKTTLQAKQMAIDFAEGVS